MSKKFFSLIKSGSLHIAPKTKMIDADTFSKLLTLEGAIEEVKKDAEAYKKEVAAECEKLKEQAQMQGFEAGMKEWASQLAQVKKQLQKAQEDVSAVVIPLALKAAKKIVGREIEANKELVLDIVKNNLQGVMQHKTITIYVNKEDLSILEKNRAELKNLLDSAEVLNFRERNDIEPGGCVIESEVGIINAQLENQWLILEQAFERLNKAQSEKGQNEESKANQT